MKFPKHLNPPEFLKGKFCLLGLLEGIFGVLWVPLSVWFLRRPWGESLWEQRTVRKVCFQYQKLQDVCAQVSCHSDGPPIEGQTEDHPKRRTRNTRKRWEEGKRTGLWVPGHTPPSHYPGSRASASTGCMVITEHRPEHSSAGCPGLCGGPGTAGPCWPGADSLREKHTWQGGEAGERLDEIYRWQRPQEGGPIRGWKVWKESLKDEAVRKEDDGRKALRAEETTWKRLSRAQTSQ